MLRMSTEKVNMFETRRNSIVRELAVKKFEAAIEVPESDNNDYDNENDADNNVS